MVYRKPNRMAGKCLVFISWGHIHGTASFEILIVLHYLIVWFTPLCLYFGCELCVRGLGELRSKSERASTQTYGWKQWASFAWTDNSGSSLKDYVWNRDLRMRSTAQALAFVLQCLEDLRGRKCLALWSSLQGPLSRVQWRRSETMCSGKWSNMWGIREERWGEGSCAPVVRW